MEFCSHDTENGDLGTEIRDVESIVIRDLAYRYNENDRDVLYNINLCMKRGECIGIAGKNGAGKTTFINILLGLLKPTHGDILINGSSFAHCALNSLRDNIGYMPQTPIVFSGTLKSNLCFLDASNCDEDITKICSSLGMCDWVESLPNKFETHFNNPQQTLSGGEKQRIALARTLLKKRNIYILDEPSSALDQKTKIQLMEMVRLMKQSSIVIIVSHDNFLLDRCDAIYNLNEPI